MSTFINLTFFFLHLLTLNLIFSAHRLNILAYNLQLCCKCTVDVSFSVTHVCMFENIIPFYIFRSCFPFFVHLLLSCTFPPVSMRAGAGAGALIRSVASLWFESQNYCRHTCHKLIILGKIFCLNLLCMWYFWDKHFYDCTVIWLNKTNSGTLAWVDWLLHRKEGK